jgi:hypothetical protein
MPTQPGTLSAVPKTSRAVHTNLVTADHAPRRHQQHEKMLMSVIGGHVAREGRALDVVTIRGSRAPDARCTRSETDLGTRAEWHGGEEAG